MYADHLALMHEGGVVAFGPAAKVLWPETLAEFAACRSTTSQTAQSSSSTPRVLRRLTV
jgi:ABC-type hemin transport system ATPase subunit